MMRYENLQITLDRYFLWLIQFSSVQFSYSVMSNSWRPHEPHSTPGLPAHHQLPEFIQTHAHWVGDAIQPSHPLSSPSPPAPNPPHIRVFSNESTLRMRWPKYWSFSFSISPSSEHPGLISSRMDWLYQELLKFFLRKKRVFLNIPLCCHILYVIVIDFGPSWFHP